VATDLGYAFLAAFDLIAPVSRGHQAGDVVFAQATGFDRLTVCGFDGVSTPRAREHYGGGHDMGFFVNYHGIACERADVDSREIFHGGSFLKLQMIGTAHYRRFFSLGQVSRERNRKRAIFALALFQGVWYIEFALRRGISWQAGNSFSAQRSTTRFRRSKVHQP